MIWVFEYLNEKELKDLKYLNPLMDFQFDFENRIYYWQTYCAGFEDIYEDKDLVLRKPQYLDIPIELIDLFPNETECIDNTPTLIDSYDYLMELIKMNKFHWSWTTFIRAVPKGNRYFTIDSQRLKAFRKAVELGFEEFQTIPVLILNTLRKEIRRIKLFKLEQVRQGFICDDWEEARKLSGYLQNPLIFKEIEENYKWIPDYLSIRKENVCIDIIAIPVSIYFGYFSHKDEHLDQVDLKNLLKKF